MIVTLTQHVVGQMRVRATGKGAALNEKKLKLAIEVALNANRKSTKRVRDMVTAKVFRAVHLHEFDTVALLADLPDGLGCVAVTVITAGMWSRSISSRKYVVED